MGLFAQSVLAFRRPRSHSRAGTSTALVPGLVAWLSFPPILLAQATADPSSVAGSSGAPTWLVVLLGLALVAVVARLVQREKHFARERDRRLADDHADLQFSRERLAAETERLAATLESILEAILTTDTEGRVVGLNRAAEELLGRPAREVIGRPVGKVMPLVAEAEPDAPFDPIAALAEVGSPIRFEERYQYRRPDGVEPASIELSGAPIEPEDGELEGYVLAARDVTDRQSVEAELAKAQKVESLGLLAGGIAHDFNNLLTIILGNFSLVQSEGVLPAIAAEPLEEAEKAALRARGLADQLLTFASGGAPRTVATDLGELLREAVAFAFRENREGAPAPRVRCKVDLPSDLPPVDVDPEQVVQVFNNLLVGARQATGDGVVTVTARATKVALGQSKLRPGTYVEVTIRDQGEGLSAAELEKIFDPYFTTEKGAAGLGLATSYSIIKRHRGAIEVDSTPGEGTRFVLLLRAAKGPVQHLSTERESPAKPVAQRRVLVMDDEHSILALLSAALKRLGFEAVTTPDGDAAIAACRQAIDEDRPFQLAILDLTIPGGMGGVEAAAKLSEIQSDLLLVASSGYARNPALVDYRDHGFHQVLVKPYRIPDLADLLDSLLGLPDRPSRRGST